MEVVTLLTIMEPDLRDSALLMKHLEKHSSIHKCLRRGTDLSLLDFNRETRICGIPDFPFP